MCATQIVFFHFSFHWVYDEVILISSARVFNYNLWADEKRKGLSDLNLSVVATRFLFISADILPLSLLLITPVKGTVHSPEAVFL